MRPKWHPMAISLLFSSAAVAQLTPVGPEFQVNTYTTSAQQLPDVSVAPAGDFVVVWQSSGSAGTDTFGTSIQAQRFDALGAPVGDEFQVNTYTTNDQQVPSVRKDAAGDFVVSFYSNGSFGNDPDDSVQARLYDASGVPAGAQFQVNTYTYFAQRRSTIVFDDQGEFTVVWAGWAASGDTDISGQRFDSFANPIGSEFLVNDYTPDRQSRTQTAATPTGDFVVVWQSPGSNGTDTDGYSIQAKRYDALGNPLGGEFQVNTYTTNHQRYPSVAIDDAGNFVVVWESLVWSGPDTSGAIVGQRFDADGLPLGGEFQVNTYTTGNQQNPSVAMSQSGDFAVAWQSLGSGGSDNSGHSIQAQHFAGDGTPLGVETQVNTYIMSNQELPAIATDRAGNFVVTWQSFGPDGSNFGVQAQRLVFDLPFEDGFESGDTDRWSHAAP